MRDIAIFQKKIMQWYRVHGRHDLPWRKTKNPYEILVSEYMLQQTQVSRVETKYSEFLLSFPTVQSLASASSADALRLWKGLGYNRRALNLKRAAEMMVREFFGAVPKDIEDLERLPGVGPYTARAIATFAWNKKEVFIETNIRRVYLDYFFKNKEGVRDEELLIVIKRTLPMHNPRCWYWALMDYGAGALRDVKNPNRRSSRYTKQSRFEGSRRYVRAKILDAVMKSSRGIMLRDIERLVESDTYLRARAEEVPFVLNTLQNEGFLRYDKKRWRVLE